MVTGYHKKGTKMVLITVTAVFCILIIASILLLMKFRKGSKEVAEAMEAGVTRIIYYQTKNQEERKEPE